MRWSELNKPNIVITKIEMQPYKIISKADIVQVTFIYLDYLLHCSYYYHLIHNQYITYQKQIE